MNVPDRVVFKHMASTTLLHCERVERPQPMDRALSGVEDNTHRHYYRALAFRRLDADMDMVVIFVRALDDDV